MVATVAAGTTAAYYTSLADYYSGAEEPSGRWLGVGFKAGVTAGSVVESETFSQLHAALDDRSRSLLANHGGKVDRVGGYDVTFSAPKSVSIAWALGDETLRVLIEKAQETAVQSALRMLEDNAAFCRSGKAGRYREAVRLTVAAFQHGSSRPETHADGDVFGDPNLHTHAVILNLAQKANGRFGALDGKPLFAWKMAAGATYHASLAKELGDLGFAITDVGKNGIFELDGVDGGLRSYFSARRQRIEEELAAGDLISAEAPALAAAVARATRKQKKILESDDRFRLWHNRAKSIGFDPETIIDRLRKAGLDQPAVDTDEIEKQVRARIDDVLRDLTEHESVFGKRQLHAALAASLVGLRTGPERVASEIEALLSTGGIALLAKDAWGHEAMTTPEMLAIEREIGAMARRLQTGPREDRGLSNVDQLIAAAKLGAEQAAAVRAAAQADAITIIEGAPGSGKTTTLRPIKDAYEASGYRVLGAATAWRVAHMLRDDLAIEARATDSWLHGVANGRPFLDARTVLIVDEAGLLSSRQMHGILTAIEAAKDDKGRTPRLVLVGDRDQLQSVGAGSGLGLVARALPTNRVEVIQRQRELWARDAILAFGKGDADPALQAFADRGRLHEHEGPVATIRALVDASEAAGVLHDSDILLIAKTNVQVRAISKEVRRRLRASASITGDDVAVKAATRSGHTTELPLAAGDRVTFLARANFGGQDVINGTQAVITSISGASDEIGIEALVDGRRIAFSPKDIADDYGRARLAHAYATTIHGAQGLTAERAFVLLTPEMDRHDIYVASSRSRGSTELFIDRKAVEASARAELPLNLRLTHPIDDEARRTHLATRLARSGIKTTTLDVLADVTKALEHDTWIDRSAENRTRRSRGVDREPKRSRLGLEYIAQPALFISRRNHRPKSRETFWGSDQPRRPAPSHTAGDNLSEATPMKTIYENLAEEARIEFGAALADYFQEISTLGPIHDGQEDLGACLSIVLAPDPHFPDRAMTEEEDRIIRAYFGRVTTRLDSLASLARHLNERKRELRY